MRADAAPFVVREGRLYLEDLPLERLAAELEGRAAWVISDAAVRAALDGLDGPRTVDIGSVGAIEVLALFAKAGHWARVFSSHELDLAERAGFPAERVVAGGRVKDDRLVKDSLERGIRGIELRDEEDERNVGRIARALGHAVPGPVTAPATMPAGSFDGCGGLFAPVLRGAPGVAIDAVFDADASGAPFHLWPLEPGDASAGTVSGLSRSGATDTADAIVHGALRRADWVAIPCAEALSLRSPDTAHETSPTVLVREALWRQLDPRALPEEG